MSAIWGTLSFQTTLPVSTDSLMRQPYGAYKIDRFHTKSCGQVYMGCGIQYITAQSINEPLPIYDEARRLLFTADCYLDNRQELLDILSPEDRTVPDGTLMYLGYLKWGMDCVSHFLGAFTMAVYRWDTKTLYLASDPMASRCLYYYQDSEGIAFSTLLKPILQLHPHISKNELFLKDFLYAPKMVPIITEDDTPYQNIKKLPPATWLALREGGAVVHRYWDPVTSPFIPPRAKGSDAWGAAFLQLYRTCVEQTMGTHQNTAIALSSGLDSSSVGALAAQHLAQNGKKLWAFTYVPYEKPQSKTKYRIEDETSGIQDMVKMYPNILPHFLNNGGKNAVFPIVSELDTIEIPFKAFVNLPSLLEIGNQAQNAGCKVLLIGQCGNSTVSYGEFPDILYDAFSSHHYLRYLQLIWQYGKSVHSSRKKLLLGSFRDFRAEKRKKEYHYEMENPFLKHWKEADYPLEERFHMGNRNQLEKLFSSEKDYRQNCYFRSVLTYLGEIETKSGLAAGLLYRDPTRDPRIFSFCAHMPYEFFCCNGTPRWLIRGNFRDLLPSSILDHWRTRGVQNADWILRVQRDWDRVGPILESSLKASPLFKLLESQKISEFFESAQVNPADIDPILLKNIVFLYTLSEFCKNI